MTRLGLAILATLAFSAIAAPASQTIYIGQLFQLSFTQPTVVSGLNGRPIPSWMMFNDQILQGIPTEYDLGLHTITILTNGKPSYTVSVRVIEETEGLCGEEETYWIEAYFNANNTIENRIHAAHEFAEEEEKSAVKTLRVYSFDFSVKNRDLTELMQEKVTGNYVAIWKVACADYDEATNVLDEFIDHDVDYDSVKLSKGFYRKSNLPEPTVIGEQPDDITSDEVTEVARTVEELRTTTELIRTTRKIADQKPILLNALPLYTCVRGEICELRVPAETFKDVEDGDTFKLRLSILALDHAEIWMTTDMKGMSGVPMRTGEYSYRLEGRDRAGQMATAAFSVIVKPSLPVNHKVQFDLDIPTPASMAANPQKRIMFIRAMSRALRASASSFTLQEITSKNDKTVITWSNNTLPYKTCDDAGLEAMSSKMIIKQKMRTKTEFVKAMGNLFYVRKASLNRIGNCEDDVEVSTTAPTVESVQEADSQLILICILLFCLLVLAIVIIIYCACVKRDGKKKSTATEYATKGHPVVFPDEVEDLDPTHAGTPMLAREERPPLKVSQHENPLYKPPPPIASNSPRLGQGHTSSKHNLQSPFIPP